MDKEELRRKKQQEKIDKKLERLRFKYGHWQNSNSSLPDIGAKKIPTEEELKAAGFDFGEKDSREKP